MSDIPRWRLPSVAKARWTKCLVLILASLDENGCLQQRGQTIVSPGLELDYPGNSSTETGRSVLMSDPLFGSRERRLYSDRRTCWMCSRGVRRNPVVQTREGPVLGRRLVKKKHKPYLVFKGIPFAKSPTLGGRFKDPKPRKEWTGIWDARRYRKSCMTYLLWIKIGSEDCLYLNLFAPETSKYGNENGLVPVIVWIHGGAFFFGSEQLKFIVVPSALTDQGVIFISIHYRLGTLGFISTGDAVIPGNYGMKDIILSLKWVQRNIEAFGGDPNRVVVMGHSAGGAAVHALTMSPLSEGLIHAGISMSGTLITPWATRTNVFSIAKILAKSLQCPVHSSVAMLICLERRSAEDLIKGMKVFYSMGIRFAAPFTITTDPEAQNPFLPEHPLKLISSGKIKQIPVIFGALPDEQKFFTIGMLYDKSIYHDLKHNWDDNCGQLAFWGLKKFPQFWPPPEVMKNLCARTRCIYSGGEIDADGTATDILQFSSDHSFRFGAVAAAILHSKWTGGKAYVYNWDYKNQKAWRLVDFWNLMYAFRLEFILTSSKDVRKFRMTSGKSHADEQILLLGEDTITYRNENDHAVQNFIARSFARFCATGNPSVSDFWWPNFEQGFQTHVVFQVEPRVESKMLTEEHQRLLSDWYDAEQLSFPGIEEIPTLSQLLGFDDGYYDYFGHCD